MEENTIDILENFALISQIMPFFGSTHKSFLLLSRLSVKTRNKLDDYFMEFTNLMFEYSEIFKFCNDSYKWYEIWIPVPHSI